MAYLEKHKILHCDLCASNVLLNENNDAKISDFGLSRYLNDVNKKDIMSNKVRIRWTAPEVLENKNYTIKSDVWSFGILLWEIYTYGRVPFPRIKLENLKYHLKSGNKMSSPEHCSFEIYEIMCSCWNLNWKMRPKFDVLEKVFLKIVEKNSL
jgi:serine/threonine protein kinase